MKMLDKLRGGDLRSIGRSEEVVADIIENPKLVEKKIRPLVASKKTRRYHVKGNGRQGNVNYIFMAWEDNIPEFYGRRRLSCDLFLQGSYDEINQPWFQPTKFPRLISNRKVPASVFQPHRFHNPS